MSVRLGLGEVRALCVAALRRAGLSEAGCEAVAETITAAERDGCKSHGVFRLPGWCASLKSGKIDGKAVPSVEVASPSMVKVNANHSVAPLALKAGLPVLVRQAKETGVAVMCVKDSLHFSALWHEVEFLANQGLVGLAFVNTRSFVAHAGGHQRVYGTNPMAFAFPRQPPHPPLVFDQASSAMARGEIQLCERDAKPLPPAVALDANGQPTTSASEALKGAQLPFGGHKGAAIALMVELLAGALCESPFGFEGAEEEHKWNDGGPTRHGEVVIAIDSERAWGNSSGPTLARVEQLLALILEEPGTRLPSDRRYRTRKVTPTEGVEVDSKLWERVKHLAGQED